MPASLDRLEVAFQQLHHDCVEHAEHRASLLAEVRGRYAATLVPLRGRDRSYSCNQVHEQERHLRQLRGAAQAERHAIGMQAPDASMSKRRVCNVYAVCRL